MMRTQTGCRVLENRRRKAVRRRPTLESSRLDYAEFHPAGQSRGAVLHEHDAAGLREGKTGPDGPLIIWQHGEDFAMLGFVHADGGGFTEEAGAPADGEETGPVVAGGFEPGLQLGDGGA